MAYQTSVKNAKTIRFGSAKTEVGKTLGSLVDLGLASDVEFTEESEPKVIKPDNGPEIEVGRINHTATVKFNLWEVNLENLALIRGGIDSYTTIPGTPTSVSNEKHVLTDIESERLNFRNGDGSVVTSIVVKDEEGNTAALNTDYVVFVDPEGYTCIARVAGSTVISSGEEIQVSYSYTPNTAVKLSTGGLDTISPRVVRLTNTNAEGKVFRITVYSAKNQKGIDIKLPSDDSSDNMQPSIELKGIKDITRAIGDQLYEIYDEQGVL